MQHQVAKKPESLLLFLIHLLHYQNWRGLSHIRSPPLVVQVPPHASLHALPSRERESMRRRGWHAGV